MFKVTDTEGVTREAEGIDVNVWNSDLYGSGPARGIVITGYAMSKDAVTGFWTTHSTFSAPLFSADTNLPVDEWDDAWYGYSEDNTPTDVPYDVNQIVNNILKEISL